VHNKINRNKNCCKNKYSSFLFIKIKIYVTIQGRVNFINKKELVMYKLFGYGLKDIPYINRL